MSWKLINGLPDIVIKWRTDNNVTQAKLSNMIYEATGESLSVTAISKFENNIYTGIPQIQTIAKFSSVIDTIDLPSWLVRERGE